MARCLPRLAGATLALCSLWNPSAKVRHKKHPAKDFFVGWELVGVLVGVLPFSPISVGVLVFWWEFWWEFLLKTKKKEEFLLFRTSKQPARLQSNTQIVHISCPRDGRIIGTPHRHLLCETLHSHSLHLLIGSSVIPSFRLKKKNILYHT